VTDRVFLTETVVVVETVLVCVVQPDGVIETVDSGVPFKGFVCVVV
jgi:hypothetical protein